MIAQFVNQFIVSYRYVWIRPDYNHMQLAMFHASYQRSNAPGAVWEHAVPGHGANECDG